MVGARSSQKQAPSDEEGLAAANGVPWRHPEVGFLRTQSIRLREQAADLAQRIADGADAFASHLEAAAERGDAERRLRLAEKERAIAILERENGARLRAACAHLIAPAGPGSTGNATTVGASLPAVPLARTHAEGSQRRAPGTSSAVARTPSSSLE